jgi:hypothetical protein
MRKLASIRKIDEIRPIKDAEAIECAVVGGSTRIVCNPRGYIHYEDRADNFMLKVVEV